MFGHKIFIAVIIFKHGEQTEGDSFVFLKPSAPIKLSL